MGDYFSFDRLITPKFVKVLYLLGFTLLTIGGIALAIGAGFRLYNGEIRRPTGWRYVAIGIGAVILGNLVWRIFCEFWIVLFNMHTRLVSINQSLYGVQSHSLRDTDERFVSSRSDTTVESPL